MYEPFISDPVSSSASLRGTITGLAVLKDFLIKKSENL